MADLWHIPDRFLEHILRGPFVYLFTYFTLRFFWRKNVGFSVYVWRWLWIIPIPGFRSANWWRRLFGKAHQSKPMIVLLGTIWVPLFEFQNIAAGQSVTKAIYDWWSWPVAMTLSAWALHRYYWTIQEDIHGGS